MQCTFSCDENLQSEYTIHSTIEVIKGDADELSVEFVSSASRFSYLSRYFNP